MMMILDFLSLQSSLSAQRFLQDGSSPFCRRTRSWSFRFVCVAVRQPSPASSAPRAPHQANQRLWPFSGACSRNADPLHPHLQPQLHLQPPTQTAGPGRFCPQGQLRGALSGARQGLRGSGRVRGHGGFGGRQAELSSAQRVRGQIRTQDPHHLLCVDWSTPLSGNTFITVVVTTLLIFATQQDHAHIPNKPRPPSSSEPDPVSGAHLASPQRRCVTC